MGKGLKIVGAVVGTIAIIVLSIGIIAFFIQSLTIEKGNDEDNNIQGIITGSIKGEIPGDIEGVVIGNIHEISNNKGIKYVLGIYFLGLPLCAVIYALFSKEKWGFSEVSFPSMVIFCLEIPTIISLLIIWISKIFANFSPQTNGAILVITHIIAISIWHIHKLWFKKLRESDLMKIDFYSTCAILPLTIIWILYKIDPIEYSFSIFMGMFMVIQLIIKYKQIRGKEKEESETTTK